MKGNQGKKNDFFLADVIRLVRLMRKGSWA